MFISKAQRILQASGFYNRITAHSAQPLYTVGTHRDLQITPLVSLKVTHFFQDHFLSKGKAATFESLKNKAQLDGLI